MYTPDSESWMEAAAEHANIGFDRRGRWHPNVARFFPHNVRGSVYDVCGFLYHATHRGVYCPSCRFGYAGHLQGLLRGLFVLYGGSFLKST